jgi:RNA polymerase sigma factor (sigma-70 family)
VTVVGAVDVARVSEWDGLTSTYLALHGEAVEWAVRITRDRAMAEDVVQDAFVQVFSRLRTPLGDDAVRRYVRRAVVNAALSRLRSERRRRSREVRASDETWGEAEAGADHELWELVQRLPRRQFAVIALRYWLDQSEAETAQLLRCRVGTVKSLAARAVATLRKEIGDG